MKHGGGYIKDAPHKRTQKDFAEHPAFKSPATPLPVSVSLREFEHTPILDQNNVGSCTGHGTAQALVVSFNAAGKPLPFTPSPKSVYALARTFELGSERATLTDSGAMPADAMNAINEFGIRAMQAPSPEGYNSDCDETNCNQKESLLDLEADHHELVVGQHRINETDSTWISQVQYALAAKCAVDIGIFVDSAFENWDPSKGPLDSVDLNDPNGGGHWLCVVGYETKDSELVFDLLNSWSSSWGDAGHIQVTEAWMRAAVSDVYPITAALEAA